MKHVLVLNVPYSFVFKADINLAVQAAKRAFHRNSEWRLLDAAKRRSILTKFGDLIERDLYYLAELESYNNGTVLSDAYRFIGAAAEGARYIASLADKIQGDTVPLSKCLYVHGLFIAKTKVLFPSTVIYIIIITLLYR